MSNLVIRPGAEADLPPIVDIYNYYVRESAITFDVEPYTVEARRPWFAMFAETGRYRLLVAEQAGQVVGYANSAPLRPKPAYDVSVETSVYILHTVRGNGIGRQLYAALFDALKDEDLHRAYAGITLPNDASIALHESFGFECAGVWREVGRKADAYYDVAWYEKSLP